MESSLRSSSFGFLSNRRPLSTRSRDFPSSKITESTSSSPTLVSSLVVTSPLRSCEFSFDKLAVLSGSSTRSDFRVRFSFRFVRLALPKGPSRKVLNPSRSTPGELSSLLRSSFLF